MYTASNIEDRVKDVFERAAEAALKAGRSPDEIEIVAVSKNHPPEAVREAVRAGIKHIGENRIQEAEPKFRWLEENHPELQFKRHMVGHLQTNKSGKAIRLFQLIHSVDSLRLGNAISKRAVESGRTVEILVEVKTSTETTKFGIEPENAIELVESLAGLSGVKVRGLMTVGAFLPDPEEVRPCFIALRKLSEEIASRHIPGVEMRFLSMGMTNDFEAAIEEGANMVRIGTAIFGARR